MLKLCNIPPWYSLLKLHYSYRQTWVTHGQSPLNGPRGKRRTTSPSTTSGVPASIVRSASTPTTTPVNLTLRGTPSFFTTRGAFAANTSTGRIRWLTSPWTSFRSKKPPIIFVLVHSSDQAIVRLNINCYLIKWWCCIWYVSNSLNTKILTH